MLRVLSIKLLQFDFFFCSLILFHFCVWFGCEARRAHTRSLSMHRFCFYATLLWLGTVCIALMGKLMHLEFSFVVNWILRGLRWKRRMREWEWAEELQEDFYLNGCAAEILWFTLKFIREREKCSSARKKRNLFIFSLLLRLRIRTTDLW